MRRALSIVVITLRKELTPGLWATGSRMCRGCKEHLDHYTLSICLMSKLFYTFDYMTNVPELKALNNYNEGYEKCDFHKLTGWGNWLKTNEQFLNSNPQKGGGGKLE